MTPGRATCDATKYASPWSGVTSKWMMPVSWIVPATAAGLERLDRREVAPDDVVGGAVVDDPALLEQQRALAERAYRLHVVAHEDDGRAFTRDLGHPADAAALEVGVADREHLVD